MQREIPGNHLEHQTFQAVVKNTFIQAEEVKSDDEARSLRRSASEGSLSKSSGSEIRYWVPSITSSSCSRSQSSQSDNLVNPQARHDGSMPLSAWQEFALSSNGVQGAHGSAIDRLEDRWIPSEYPTDATVPPGLLMPRVAGGVGALSIEPWAPPYPAAPPAVKDIWSQPTQDMQQLPREVHQAHGVTTRIVIEQMHKETGLSLEELETLGRRYDLSKVPRNERNQLTSVGSIVHDAGEDKCAPCLFWFRKACAKGVLCGYCHYRHKGQRNKRIRPSKKTRQAMRMNAVENNGEDSDDSDLPDAGQGSARGPPMPQLGGMDAIAAPMPQPQPQPLKNDQHLQHLHQLQYSMQHQRPPEAPYGGYQQQHPFRATRTSL